MLSGLSSARVPSRESINPCDLHCVSVGREGTLGTVALRVYSLVFALRLELVFVANSLLVSVVSSSPCERPPGNEVPVCVCPSSLLMVLVTLLARELLKSKSEFAQRRTMSQMGAFGATEY